MPRGSPSFSRFSKRVVCSFLATKYGIWGCGYRLASLSEGGSRLIVAFVNDRFSSGKVLLGTALSITVFVKFLVRCSMIVGLVLIDGLEYNLGKQVLLGALL